MNSNIHGGHRDRMRERFLKEGADGFADHELLEMLLYGVIPRGNTNEIAHHLLKEFGSFSNLLESDHKEIQKTAGVGERSALFLSMIYELIRRYERERMELKLTLSSIQRSVEYCRALVGNYPVERLYLLCIDNAKRVIHTSKLAEGTIAQVYVHPRTVVKKVLRYNAAGVMLCHNHPHGWIKPSKDDVELTVRIQEVLRLIDVEMVDHIIIGEDKYYSFFESGLIKKGNKEEF